MFIVIKIKINKFIVIFIKHEKNSIFIFNFPVLYERKKWLSIKTKFKFWKKYETKFSKLKTEIKFLQTHRQIGEWMKINIFFIFEQPTKIKNKTKELKHFKRNKIVSKIKHKNYFIFRKWI